MPDQAEATESAEWNFLHDGRSVVMTLPQVAALYEAAKFLVHEVTDHYHHEAANPFPRRVAEATRGLSQALEG
jgi:hypothetical protein